MKKRKVAKKTWSRRKKDILNKRTFLNKLSKLVKQADNLSFSLEKLNDEVNS